MSRRTPTRHSRRAGRRALVAGGGLFVVLIGVGAALLATGQHAAAPVAPAATPTVDPRLIVRPRTVAIAGVLSNGLHLAGTFYPAYPGRNTLYLTVRRGAQGRYVAGRIALSATMPGMAMLPVRGTLAAGGQRYTGTLTLPMFGTYRVTVAIATPGAAATGAITLTLSLPGL